MRFGVYNKTPAWVYAGIDPWAPLTEYNAHALDVQAARALGDYQSFPWLLQRQDDAAPPPLNVEDHFWYPRDHRDGDTANYEITVKLECGKVLWGPLRVCSGHGTVAGFHNIPLKPLIDEETGEEVPQYLRQVIHMDCPCFSGGTRFTVRVGWLHTLHPVYVDLGGSPRPEEFEDQWHVVAPRYVPLVVAVGPLRVHVRRLKE
jgi:hypothetical protein